jgi:Fe-S-cluster containining protein
MTKSTQESCTCANCQAQCKHKPGWFKPGEPEKVAEFLGLTLQELFSQYLMPDSWELAEGSLLTLSPAIKGKKPGEYLSWAQGECVFLKEGLCSIHAVKPFECRMVTHDTRGGVFHQEAGLAWAGHQDQIATLRENLP